MPIAKPIPIDDIGETINIEKIIAINIVMIIGCVLVNPLITSPKPNVINLVYGKINSPLSPPLHHQRLVTQSYLNYLIYD